MMENSWATSARRASKSPPIQHNARACISTFPIPDPCKPMVHRVGWHSSA